MKTDIALLAAAREMNGDALTEIFDLYAPAIYKYALRVCNSAVTADQIVGDVFAKLLENLSAGRGPRVNLRSYLFEIAYHLFVDEVRYSHRRAPIEAVELLNFEKIISAKMCHFPSTKRCLERKLII